MFLLFCLLLRCHEGSSVNDFPLSKPVKGPIAKRHPTCGTGGVLNTRYCGTMNVVSTEFCSERKNYRGGLTTNDQRLAPPLALPVHCASCGAIPSNLRSSRIF